MPRLYWTLKEPMEEPRKVIIWLSTELGIFVRLPMNGISKKITARSRKVFRRDEMPIKRKRDFILNGRDARKAKNNFFNFLTSLQNYMQNEESGGEESISQAHDK